MIDCQCYSLLETLQPVGRVREHHRYMSIAWFLSVCYLCAWLGSYLQRVGGHMNASKLKLKSPEFDMKSPADIMAKVPKIPKMRLNRNKKGGGIPETTDPDDPKPDLNDPIPKREWPLRPYKRRVKLNLLGCLFFVLYLIALGFYLWVRITKTLGLGGYVW